jgi:hypothetical protein
VADDESCGLGFRFRSASGGQGCDLYRQQTGEHEDTDTEVVVPSQDHDPDDSEYGNAEQRPRLR